MKSKLEQLYTTNDNKGITNIARKSADELIGINLVPMVKPKNFKKAGPVIVKRPLFNIPIAQKEIKNPILL